tara:strand:+ start:173 stop:514 length:342 start_codon:yes stop_codon:yes gene_type:complete
MVRHWIGKSLSSCTRDILKGDVNEEEVLLICTSTRHPFHNPDHFYDRRVFEGGIKESELLERLWNQGRIHQPRYISDAYNEHAVDHIFSYDHYRHKHWFSIKDQALLEQQDDD